MMQGISIAGSKAGSPVRVGVVVAALFVVVACMVGVVLGGGQAAWADEAKDTSLSSVARSTESAKTPKASKAANSSKPSREQLKAFKAASADFGMELFGRAVAARGKKDNVTVAPMSVLTALAMTANGAKGKTARQMRDVLADGMSVKALDKSLRWYNSQLVNVEKARITSANAIWHADAGLTLKQSFQAVCRAYFDADVRAADFSSASAVADINNWVAEKTNGMIKRLVGQLDRSTRVVLANALYFDAEWRAPYDQGSVHAAKFTNANGSKSSVKMMYSRENRYLEGYGATGFMRPYAKGYSYVALLPAKGVSTKQFIAELDGAALRKLISKAKAEAVNAGIPKYTVEYSDDEMGRQLAAMGMGLAFDANRANFSKMGIDSTGNIFIGDVVHKTKVEVDERGTKAAAVTGVVAKASSMPIVQPKTVILDRPFVYAIVDNATKLPVFIGAVNTL